ncbi:hypothetical protein B0H21DRAFT_825879 [Amylocystis lapponica]|nr:hypothetical protein B0H21DRAFT_825879 [Amylocystis lapponica]
MDLQGNIMYDADEPFQRLVENLRNSSISSFSSKVAECLRKEHADLLGMLLPVQIKPSERARVKRQDEMHSALQKIFEIIETAGKEHGLEHNYYRKMVNLVSDFPRTECLFHSVSQPDFALTDVPAPVPRTDFVTRDVNVSDILWRQIPSFIEVEHGVVDSPIPHSADTVKDIVAQGADCTRTILFARPFQLYVFCLYICARDFWLGMFDRGGALMSRKYTITGTSDDNLELFVCIIRRMTCDMSHAELGQDPTISLAENNTYYQKSPYPSFKVEMGSGGTHAWYTENAPIRSSLSLLGPGTSTWIFRDMIARQIRPSNTLLLKVVWRSRHLTSESDIYNRFTGKELPGVAHFVTGGDSTLGEALWKYKTDKELIYAFRAAIKGHRHLSDLGILHRDITPGNVFLRRDVDLDDAGFLANLELATFLHDDETQNMKERIPSPISEDTITGFREDNNMINTNEAEPGPFMTPGTALFMALGILWSIDGRTVIAHSIHHDLESFILVIFYTVYRKARSTASKEIKDEFLSIFSPSSLKETITARIEWTQFGASHLGKSTDISPGLSYLLSACMMMLRAQNPMADPGNLEKYRKVLMDLGELGTDKDTGKRREVITAAERNEAALYPIDT